MLPVKHWIPTRQYTVEFQEAALNQVFAGGRSLIEVARRLEMPAKMLDNCVRRVRLGQGLAPGVRG